MIIDCIADLHGFKPPLAGGDLLIVAGDLTARDTVTEHLGFSGWLYNQPYDKIVLIAGNHDGKMDDCKPFDQDNLSYLQDSGTIYKGIKIWGSPWSLLFKGINEKCTAFTGSEKDLKKKYELIPNDIDILITHTPPHGIFDRIQNERSNTKHTGSISLRNEVIDRIKPHYHIFGHIHEHGGKSMDCCTTTFINCSYVNEQYKPVNNPVRIIL